uniref:Uncharacterized protein n=1 Tax=Opuntia streptacantha TaxID=393608 RepID=A0A7C8Z3I7_OPUST
MVSAKHKPPEASIPPPTALFYFLYFGVSPAISPTPEVAAQHRRPTATGPMIADNVPPTPTPLLRPPFTPRTLCSRPCLAAQRHHCRPPPVSAVLPSFRRQPSTSTSSHKSSLLSPS